jgi:hypothetical protein
LRLVFAYLDPVTGGALLQVLLAAAAAVGLGYQYIRRFFRSMKDRFVPAKADEEKAPTSPVA